MQPLTTFEYEKKVNSIDHKADILIMMHNDLGILLQEHAAIKPGRRGKEHAAWQRENDRLLLGSDYIKSEAEVLQKALDAAEEAYDG